MNIGYVGMKNSFSLEIVKLLKAEFSSDTFIEWPPKETDPTSVLDVLIAMGHVAPELFKDQAKLGLLQMASAGYDGVDVEAAT